MALLLLGAEAADGAIWCGSAAALLNSTPKGCNQVLPNSRQTSAACRPACPCNCSPRRPHGRVRHPSGRGHVSAGARRRPQRHQGKNSVAAATGPAENLQRCDCMPLLQRLLRHCGPVLHCPTARLPLAAMLQIIHAPSRVHTVHGKRRSATRP